MVSAAITGMVSSILGQLTPVEKFMALKRWNTSRPTVMTLTEILTNRWIILTGASLVFLLTLLFLAVRRSRLMKENLLRWEQYEVSCDRRGLTAQEREILSAIVKKSGHRRPDEIFSLPDIFHRGMSRVMQEYFSAGHNLVERKKLNVTIGQIRQKLGFQKPSGGLSVRRRSSQGLTSRDIPLGKTVSIALSSRPDGSRIDAIVIRNDEYELAVRPEIPVSCQPGQHWNVRYRFGAATYEFDSLTMVCGPEGLELNHAESVRFLNRRRFLRVPVRFPALIAEFPIRRNRDEERLAAPQFHSGIITELSGPGLRIHTDLFVDDGQRLLVIIELEQGKIIEDVAEVRGARDTADKNSFGVELIGLDDATVNELIRITNTLAIRREAKEHTPEQDLAAVATGGTYHG